MPKHRTSRFEAAGIDPQVHDQRGRDDMASDARVTSCAGVPPLSSATAATRTKAHENSPKSEPLHDCRCSGLEVTNRA